jgi:alkylation response protein AidB-like acyl-CoA dehydrogenase
VSAAPTVEQFAAEGRAWLEANAEPRPASRDLRWGEGSDQVALFRDLTPQEEEAQVDALRAWQRRKFDAGYGAIAWPVEHGGAGFSRAHELAFRRLETSFLTPQISEAVSISLEIVAPTILTLGSDEQRARWIGPLRRGDAMACQMFSEPGAGSDLGSIALRAERDGDEWVLDGQKVWTSGAHLCDVAYVIARTAARGVAKREAFTAFLVPLDAAGIGVRPIRQMTGGSNFNEAFFDGVRVPDSARMGEVGSGWGAMMTTLGFERAAAARGGGGTGPDLFGRLLLLARHSGRGADANVRQAIADLYVKNRVRSWTARRAAANSKARGVPGPEGSISKLAMTNAMRDTTEVASLLLGPTLVADTGGWGTFAWSEFVCGVPGLRIGGGTDEIQRNTIAERVLGLPREPQEVAT